MYVVDTQFYIRALTNRDALEAFDAFQQAYIAQLWVSTVVLFEVLVGANDVKNARAAERYLVGAFRGRDRLLTPSVTTWRTAARVEAALRAKGEADSLLRQRSFQNDILIAASSREIGATLISDNEKDFLRIRGVLSFRWERSLPPSATEKAATPPAPPPAS